MENNDQQMALDILRDILEHKVNDTLLFHFLYTHHIDANGMSVESMVDAIIGMREWQDTLNYFYDVREIQDHLRICSVCGSLMCEGYCYDAGWKYYCSDECLHENFTHDGWIAECEENDQSYWTEWYDGYKFYNEE